jgi:hypothetical protein
MSRCHQSNVLTVFVNVTGPHKLLDYAVAHANLSSNGFQGLRLQRVDRYEDACLVVVTRGMYESPEAMKSALHWQTAGRNNFLWDFTNWKFKDQPVALNKDEP